MTTTAATTALVCFAAARCSVAIPVWLTYPADWTTADVAAYSAVALRDGIFLLAIADIVRRFGRRLTMLAVRDLLGGDPRPEVLLLRSFADDRLRVRVHRSDRQSLTERMSLRRFGPFEDLVAATLWRFGPVVAFSEPDTHLPPIGAARIAIANDRWVDELKERLRHCPLIVMNAGRTSAVIFEIECIRAAGALHRTIIVFPPVDRTEFQRRLEVVGAALGLRKDVLRRGYDGQTLLVLGFDPHGEPWVRVADRPDDLAYQAAILDAATAAVAEPFAVVEGPAAPVRAELPPALPTSLPVAPDRRDRPGRFRWWAPFATGLTLALALSIPPILLQPSPPAAPPIPGMTLMRARITSIVAAPDGTVEMTNASGRSLEVIEPLGDRRRTVHLFDTMPLAAAIDGDTTYAVMADPPSVVALRRGPGEYAVRWTVPLPAIATGLAVTSGRLAAAVPVTNQVVVLDSASGARLADLSPGRGPWSVTAADGLFTVGLLTDEAVVDIDAVSLAVVARTPAIGPAGLSAGHGELVVASAEAGAVTVLDRDRRVMSRIPVFSSGLSVAAGPDRIVVGALGPHKALLVFERPSGRLLASVASPAEIGHMVIVPGAVVCTLPTVPAAVRIAIP